MTIDRCIEDFYEDFFNMDSLYSEFAKQFGESYLTLFVFDLLGEHPDGISQKHLSHELRVPKQTVGSIMSSLEKRGFATHQQDAVDKRSKLHCLTPAGLERYESIVGTLHKIERRCVQRIGTKDMDKAHQINKLYLDYFKQELDSMEDRQN